MKIDRQGVLSWLCNCFQAWVPDAVRLGEMMKWWKVVAGEIFTILTLSLHHH